MKKTKKPSGKSAFRKMSAADCEKQRLQYQAVLGNDIVKRRKRKGFSQKELRFATGMGQATLSNIESGDSNVTLCSLMQLARGFHVSVVCILRAKEFRKKL